LLLLDLVQRHALLRRIYPLTITAQHGVIALGYGIVSQQLQAVCQ
jgi:hypothetical protein